MRGLRHLLLIVLVFALLSTSTAFAGNTILIELHRQGDVLVVVVNPPEPISLGGLRFQITRDAVPQTPVFLREYPNFQGVDFYNFTDPACFALRPGDVEVPLPLICQRLDPNRVYVQTLFASDVFWNDRVLQQPRTITILDDAGTRVSDCPASSFLCEINFTLSPPTSPPTSAPELAGAPADLANRELLILISAFEVFSEAAGERVNPQLSWRRQFQDVIDTVDEIPSVRVLSLPGVIRSHDEARELSEQYQATMVVWGYVDAAAVASNYTITPRWSRAEVDTIETAVFATNLDEMALYVSRDSDVEYMLNFLIGQMLYYENNDAAAVRFLDNAIRRIPADRTQDVNVWTLYFWRGTIAASYEEDYSTALTYLNTALELEPNAAQAYHNRGVIYNYMNEYDLALADFNLAIELNPDDAQTYVNRGVTFIFMDDNAAALADFNQALTLDPDYPDAYHNRGIIYSRLGNVDQAIADYDRAIELNPSLTDPYLRRGLAYAEQRDHERAIEDYNRALALDAQDPDGYLYRALSYSFSLEFELAVADLNRVVELDPTLADAYFLRGLVYQLSDKPALALADYRQYVELAGDEADAEILARIEDLEEQLGE